MLKLFAATFILSTIAQTDVGPDPTSLVTQLGAFAAAAVALVLWQRDTARLRDRIIAIEEQRAPAMIEIRDAVRASTEALTKTAAAMNAMSDSLQRVPTDAEIIRLRDALENVESGQSPRSRDTRR